MFIRVKCTSLSSQSVSRVIALGYFSKVGLLLLCHWDYFCKDDVAQRNGNSFGYFFSNNFLHFHLNRKFQKNDLKVLKVVWCWCFGLSIWSLARCLGIFWLLFKNWHFFPQSSCHPVPDSRYLAKIFSVLQFRF